MSRKGQHTAKNTSGLDVMPQGSTLFRKCFLQKYNDVKVKSDIRIPGLVRLVLMDPVVLCDEVRHDLRNIRPAVF